MFNRSPRHLKNVEDKKMFSKSTEFNELKGWTPSNLSHRLRVLHIIHGILPHDRQDAP